MDFSMSQISFCLTSRVSQSFDIFGSASNVILNCQIVIQISFDIIRITHNSFHICSFPGNCLEKCWNDFIRTDLTVFVTVHVRVVRSRSTLVLSWPAPPGRHHDNGIVSDKMPYLHHPEQHRQKMKSESREHGGVAMNHLMYRYGLICGWCAPCKWVIWTAVKSFCRSLMVSTGISKHLYVPTLHLQLE
jgi:hypothetical protein